MTALVRQFPMVSGQIRTQQQDFAARMQQAALPTGARVQLPQAWHDLNRHIDTVRMTFNLWPQIQTLVMRQCTGRGWPLYPAQRRADPALDARHEVGDRMMKRLAKMLNPSDQDPTAQAHGCYADITMSESKFITHALAARRLHLAMTNDATSKEIRFLDIGCGGGLKLLTALEMFNSATGLEFDPGYVAAARGMVAASGVDTCEVIECDAVQYDGYGQFDVIYFYRPMQDDDALVQLEQQICETAQPGTILIAPYRGFAARYGEYGCAQVEGAIFLTASSAAKARKVRALARHIGCDTRVPDIGKRTIWAPIISASAAYGFAIETDDPLAYA